MTWNSSPHKTEGQQGASMDNIQCDNCNKIAYTRWQFTGKYELLEGECFIHPKRTNIIQPERSKREDSVLQNIPEWGSDSSLNFEEWQRRCGALNTMET